MSHISDKSAMDAFNEALSAQMAAEINQPPQNRAVEVKEDRHAKMYARVIPLKERLRAKLAELPADLKLNGLHMDAIWPMCSGVQRTKPTAHAVGAALRELGWIRIRLYSDGTAPSGTWWFEPGVTPEAARAAARARKE